MIYLIALAALILLGTVARLAQKGDGSDEPLTVADNCSTCSGINEKCEQECMMEAATRDIEYYDDEELDAFAGKRSDDYTDDEAELFREVLTTMLPSDAKGWNRSLILRGINVPDQVKDELLLLLGE
ncbi:MAG: hypothetical protein IJ196_03375 [Prevotella sp.]|nr:hypothetical protein [Prevotella sp.]